MDINFWLDIIRIEEKKVSPVLFSHNGLINIFPLKKMNGVDNWRSHMVSHHRIMLYTYKYTGGRIRIHIEHIETKILLTKEGIGGNRNCMMNARIIF